MIKNAPLPLLVIFGLDYTLWPYWMDPKLSAVKSPFSKTSTGGIVDVNGNSINCYEDVPKILEKITKEGMKIAITSYTLDVIGSHELLKLFDWEKYISYVEIQETIRKVDQLRRIHEKSSTNYSDMIFFDDINGNVLDATELGIFSVHIGQNGMTMKILEDAFNEYKAKKLNETNV